MEGQLIRSVLKHHEQWKLDGKYNPLPEPVSEAGRSLTPEEEVKLIDTAKSRPEWFVAYHATVLENETGMRGVEVRNLQVKRIDLMAREIHLQKSKTKSGVRSIPLSTDALESVGQLLARAEKLGANQPDHYLIPALVIEVIEREDGLPGRVRRQRSRPTDERLADGMAQTDRGSRTRRYPGSRSSAQLGNQPRGDWDAPIGTGSTGGPPLKTDVRSLQAHQREGGAESRRCISASQGRAKSRGAREDCQVRNCCRKTYDLDNSG